MTSYRLCHKKNRLKNETIGELANHITVMIIVTFSHKPEHTPQSPQPLRGHLIQKNSIKCDTILCITVMRACYSPEPLGSYGKTAFTIAQR